MPPRLSERVVGRNLGRHLRAMQCGHLQRRRQHRVPTMPKWNDGRRWRRDLHALGVSDGNGIGNGIGDGNGDGNGNGIGYRHGPYSGC